MLFQKKDRKDAYGIPAEAKDLYPVLYVTNVLKDYQKDLLRKEVDSLRELGLIGSSFDGVLKEAVNFQMKLQEFENTFSRRGRDSGVCRSGTGGSRRTEKQFQTGGRLL